MSIPKLVYKSQKVETHNCFYQLVNGSVMWGYIHIMEYYLIIKSEVLKHGFFRNIVLSKRS